MNVVTRRVSLVALSLLVAAPCVAQSSGAFRPTGEMTAPRGFAHTATRLHDGKVLMAGCTDTTSAELYDPASHTFTPTGSMTAVRCWHSATLLADGRVLIAGGYGPGGYLRSAEVYDPSTRTFTPTADMIGLQWYHTAALLPDGRVLIAGGVSWACYTGCPAQVNNPELYDPSTGTFSLTGAFAFNGDTYSGPNVYAAGGPAVAAAVALSDGRILIASEPTSELYDPVTGVFTLTGAMTTIDCGYIAGRRATVLTNGLVLLTGGAHEDCAYFADAELYDVVTGRFTATGFMTRPRSFHSATLLPDGTVLIAGGETKCTALPCTPSDASAEIFNPSTGMFTPTANMSIGREGHSATALDDGSVLIAGGAEWVGDRFRDSARAELYVGATVPGGQPVSPDGTTVPVASQIVDNTGAAWTIGTNQIILRNGVQAAGGLGSQILWKSGTIYVLGTDSNWWQWTGSGWLNIGNVTPGGGGGTTSPDGATIPLSASQIIDGAGAVWTIGFGGAILRNGSQAAGGWGSQILWKSSTIYVLGTDSNWWQWTGSGWVNVGSMIPGGGGGGGPTSPDGTTVPLNASQIIDGAGAVWTMGSGGTIMRNGLQAAGGWGSQIVWKSGTIYVLGTDINWWQWTGSGWVNVGPVHP